MTKRSWVYWMDVSNLLAIKLGKEKLKIKGAKWGTPKNIFFNFFLSRICRNSVSMW